ncbi:MAG: hypothetical protein APG12_01487 [Candidatus Methanofastidiosum methylothiophilum]|uniref:Uncharacterized protein n=1 Tax=Candidatus Methanofastidiosum methylothiophilum TaxID=1705564 RepID=A0A150IJH3_9EURY|nr:MAG: hypothetical protein APG10_01237 [Candidatus Methanofastidiosum methylthiophilus]KYC47029.1 MAG: hypothetical protein APG11_01469 [Candidatus Methanofastidiosum methylthiophilus]KYC49466.1 MAG: hypothetical protein APG12_01487 [Candidatus Methanofastidiosum methylthiophilus]
MGSVSGELEEGKWELDTQAYVETYIKEIILVEKEGIENRYRLSLISEEGPCKKCGGIRFRYLAEVWDDQNGWVRLNEFDDNYHCSNDVCDEDGLKPREFEKLFRSIRQNAKRIDLD